MKQPKLMTFYDSLQSHFTKVYFVLQYMGQNIQEWTKYNFWNFLLK